MTPASVMKQLKANGASLVSDFHRTSPKMARLRLSRIANKSTETIKMLLKFKQRVALAVELSILEIMSLPYPPTISNVVNRVRSYLYDVTAEKGIHFP